VAVNAEFEPLQPRTEALPITDLAPQDRLRPKDDQATQVRVAALAHAEQAGCPARRVLARYEAQPGREVPALREGAAVSHRCHERGRRDRPYARYGHQPLTGRIRRRHRGDLGRHAVVALFELLPLLQELDQQTRQAGRDPGRVGREESPELAAQGDAPGAHRPSLLEQEGAYLIHQRRAVPDPPSTDAV